VRGIVTVNTFYEDNLKVIQSILSDSTADDATKYGKITNNLLFGRVKELSRIMLKQLGEPSIQSGPFQGMRFHTAATEGCYLPKLLGCYEEELHALLFTLIKEQKYQNILNIGSAEGYYSVGLARCFPQASVKAFDISSKAQAQTQALAAINQLSNRLKTYGELTVESWKTYITEADYHKTLIMMDCEGAEYTLLNPEISPELLRSDLLIELHGLSEQPERAKPLLQQFARTHTIELIRHNGRNPNQFAPLQQQKHLDQLLSVWEFRGGPTPWAWIKQKPEKIRKQSL
jgi:predicted O-methyltransferase YrrM